MCETKKILPMKYPFITSYPEKANLLSVLMNYRETIPWMLSQYIQLEVFGFFNFPRVDFYSPSTWKTCPWVYYQRISRSLVNLKWGSFSEFIIDCISQDLYVYVFLNLDSFGYNTKHDRFIYGYDKEEQKFYVADFFLHTAAAYSYEKISFEDIEKGYLSTNEENDWLSGIELISYRKEKTIFYRKSEVDYRFNINNIKTSLEEYLYSINSAKIIRNDNEQYKNSSSFIFGLEVYDFIKRYMNDASKSLDMDTRPFHVFYDHKKYMLFLVYYLCNNYYIEDGEKIYNSYYNMTQLAFKIRNLVLRYNAKPSDVVYDLIYNSINNLCSEEKETITTLIKSIEKVNDTNESNDSNIQTFTDSKTESSFTDISIFNNRIYYSDTWNANFEALGKISLSTSLPNEFLIFDFVGTSISYYAHKNNKSGYVDIYIDGNKEERIDLFSSDFKEPELLFHKENLPQGYHIIKIECTGNKNCDSQDCEISFNKLRIQKHQSIIRVENVATFIDIDTDTKGSWKSVYGSQGYEIFGSKKLLPNYTNYVIENTRQVVWASNTTDVRALQYPDSSEGRIDSFRTNVRFTIDLTIAGNELKNISFYICDTKQVERKLQIEIADYDTQQVLCTNYVDDYTEGLYLQYKIKGRVIITFICKGGPNAALSGIFFD